MGAAKATATPAAEEAERTSRRFPNKSQGFGWANGLISGKEFRSGPGGGQV